MRSSRRHGSPQPDGALRVAFDTRPAKEESDVGDYTRHLLAALERTAREGAQAIETSRPYATARSRRAEVLHAPWAEGALLRSPCPMVVTVHDVEALTRPSERLRCGGVHVRLRHLAIARATHVIVPSDAAAEEAVGKLGLERERVVVVAWPSSVSADTDDGQAAQGNRHDVALNQSSEQLEGATWEDAARATWEVYERARSEPGRAFISMPRAASAPPGASSAGLRGRAQATSAPNR